MSLLEINIQIDRIYTDAYGNTLSDPAYKDSIIKDINVYLFNGTDYSEVIDGAGTLNIKVTSFTSEFIQDYTITFIPYTNDGEGRVLYGIYDGGTYKPAQRVIEYRHSNNGEIYPEITIAFSLCYITEKYWKDFTNQYTTSFIVGDPTNPSSYVYSQPTFIGNEEITRTDIGSGNTAITKANAVQDWYISVGQNTLYINGVPSATVAVTGDDMDLSLATFLGINKVDLAAVIDSTSRPFEVVISNDGEGGIYGTKYLTIEEFDYEGKKYATYFITNHYGELYLQSNFCRVALTKDETQNKCILLATKPIPYCFEENPLLEEMAGWLMTRFSNGYPQSVSMGGMNEHYYSCGIHIFRGDVAVELLNREYKPMFIDRVNSLTTVRDYLQYISANWQSDFSTIKDGWIEHHDSGSGDDLNVETSKYETYMDYYCDTSEYYKEYENIINLIIAEYRSFGEADKKIIFFDRAENLFASNIVDRPPVISNKWYGFFGWRNSGEGRLLCEVFSEAYYEENSPMPSTIPLFNYGSQGVFAPNSLLLFLLERKTKNLVRDGEDSKELVRSAIGVTENKTEEDEKSLVRKA
jgi:hypothetical protein